MSERAVGPGLIEVLAEGGKVYSIHEDDPIRACERVADLHNVTVVAWRYPALALVPGVDPRRIIG